MDKQPRFVDAKEDGGVLNRPTDLEAFVVPNKTAPEPDRDTVTFSCPICDEAVTFAVDWETESDDMGYTVSRYPVLPWPASASGDPHDAAIVTDGVIVDQGRCRCDWTAPYLEAYVAHINDDDHIGMQWDAEKAYADGVFDDQPVGEQLTPEDLEVLNRALYTLGGIAGLDQDVYDAIERLNGLFDFYADMYGRPVPEVRIHVSPQD
jgi:hypothetical protein